MKDKGKFCITLVSADCFAAVTVFIRHDLSSITDLIHYLLENTFVSGTAEFYQQ
jgi:hypothetical protein